MRKYIETPAYYDSMPVDISAAFGDEKPAGKHGFVRTEGEALVFEDGTPARFWGVAFNAAANFPEHEYAEKVASRLAQAGVNLVRCHQLDAQHLAPNIFSFTRKRIETTRQLDPTSMDRLDYLISCLKKQGIYIYMDNIVMRKFKEADGVAHAGELQDGAKPYAVFDETLIQLQMEFCTQLWNHYNPYTGLCYKDDPAIILTEIANESDLFMRYGRTWKPSPHYEKEFREMFRDWLQEKGICYDWQGCDFYVKEEPMLQFKTELTVKYFTRMYEHLRAIGVKVPITGTNWTHGAPQHLPAHKDMDFTDNHHYYYDWRWEEEDHYVTNATINGYPYIFPALAALKLNNRPFFVSEWGMPWPNGFRAEGSIYYAAVCALQGWSGMSVHTYAYGPHADRMDRLGKEASSATINGVGSRTGCFSCWNDPAVFGLFYHASLMVRRQDIAPANKKIGVIYTNPQGMNNRIRREGLELHRIVSVLPDEEPTGCDQVLHESEGLLEEVPQILRADNGQMWRDLTKKFGVVDTPRTKIVYGKLTQRSNAIISSVSTTCADGMKVEGYTDFGVVALSSLTDDPIEQSNNMLLSTIGRACNTGFTTDGDRVLDVGTGPICSEVINAKISIRTQRDDLQVWAVNAEGSFIGELPTTYEDGQLTFTLGKTYPSNYYMIFND